MNNPPAIGIDLGGTNLKAAAVDREGRILAKRYKPIDVHRGPESILEEMAVMTREIAAELKMEVGAAAGVGVGAPGPLSFHRGCILRSANLPGWEDVRVRDRLGAKLGLRVVLDNDANVAALGEYWAGAGRGCDNLVMLTLGTGVGSGVILNGRVFHGHFENAGELGHMIVAAKGLECPCGQRGCLEQYASAAAVGRRVTAALRQGESSVWSPKVQEGILIDARHVEHGARDGDAVCVRVWDEACLYLAIACINIQHAFNPARVVLGGGLSRAGDFLVDRVRTYVQQHRWRLCEDLPEITLARIGYDAGLIGAAALIWQDQDNDPPAPDREQPRN